MDRRNFLKKLALGGAAAGATAAIPLQTLAEDQQAREAFVSQYEFFVVEERQLGTDQKPLIYQSNKKVRAVGPHGVETLVDRRVYAAIQHHTFYFDAQGQPLPKPVILLYRDAIMEHVEIEGDVVKTVWAWKNNAPRISMDYATVHSTRDENGRRVLTTTQ